MMAASSSGRVFSRALLVVKQTALQQFEALRARGEHFEGWWTGHPERWARLQDRHASHAATVAAVAAQLRDAGVHVTARVLSCGFPLCAHLGIKE